MLAGWDPLVCYHITKGSGWFLGPTGLQDIIGTIGLSSLREVLREPEVCYDITSG